MERSIDDFLNDEPAAEPETVTEQAETPTEAQPETIGQPRDDHGRFAPKEETGVEPQETAEPVPPTEQPQGLPPAEYAALKDERRKRQEAEQRAAALEAQWAQMQARQQQPQAQPEVDFWDNPQSAIATQVQQAVTQALQAEKQQQTMARIDQSEAQARVKYADYGDAFGAFQQAAAANPALIAQMTSADDPADFAYKTGKKAMDLMQVGSIDELLKAERAKWEQEVRAQVPSPVSFPATTATDGSVGARTGPAWAGPRSIDDLLS